MTRQEMLLVQLMEEAAEGILSPWPDELSSFKIAKKLKVEKYLLLSAELGKLT